MSGIPDFKRRCQITLWPLRKRDRLKPFTLIIYGRSTRDMMTVPNDVASALARRYPDYTSSPFSVEEMDTRP